MKLSDLKPSITSLKPYEAEKIHREVRKNRMTPLPTSKKTTKKQKERSTVSSNMAKIKNDPEQMLALLRILEGDKK